MRRAFAASVALGSLVVAGVAVQAPARPAASYDFGDAPDGVTAGYPGAPDVLGRFPSRAASGGPRHGAGGPRLGVAWSAESDSRQVDRDGDDGASVELRSCATSVLTLLVDARRLPAGLPVRVNAWFDWNGDGDWADGAAGGCGPEWGVQNAVVQPAALGPDRLATVELRFRAGRLPQALWWRAQVHAGTPVPHAGGGLAAPTGGGETEDFLLTRPTTEPGPRPRLACAPELQVENHKGTSLTRALMAFTSTLTNVGVGSAVAIDRVRMIRRGQVDGIAWTAPNVVGRQVLAGAELREHGRRPAVQRFSVTIRADVTIDGRLHVLEGTCRGVVAHTWHYGPPTRVDQPRRGPASPPQRAAGGGQPGKVVVNPGRPTPQSARCGASVADGLAYFRVLASCRGVDVKSTSVWYSTEPVRLWTGSRADWPREWLDSCVARFTGTNALKCYWRRGNAGRVLDQRVAPPEGGRTRIELHVLAGGVGKGGTAIVLRQTWWALGGGQFRCSQSVPAAAACAEP